MIGEQRAFVAMNRGVENIARRPRNGNATFTRRRVATGRIESPYLSVFFVRGDVLNHPRGESKIRHFVAAFV
jgi:hypothetical protein